MRGREGAEVMFRCCSRDVVLAPRCPLWHCPGPRVAPPAGGRVVLPLPTGDGKEKAWAPNYRVERCGCVCVGGGVRGVKGYTVK